MDQHSESIPASSGTRTVKKIFTKPQSPAEIWHGILFLCLAYLLGQCSPWLDTRPLGVACLCAASAYVWYILAGLSLSAIISPGIVPTGAYLAVYALVIVLRLLLLFLLDAKDPGQSHALSHQWRAFMRFLPHRKRKTNPYDDTSDYYAGTHSMLRHPPTRVATPEDAIRVSEQPHSLPDVEDIATPPAKPFSENMFLRMLTGSVAGFTLGLCALLRGGFQVYDLLGALSLVFGVPLITFLLVPGFHAEGLRLLFAECPPKVGSRERDIPLRDADRPAYTAFSTVSVILLLVAAVYAARPLNIQLGSNVLIVHLATVIALLVTLMAAQHLGLVPSVVSALCLGLAADPSLIPALLLAVLMHALIRRMSERPAIVGGWMAALLLSYFTSGIGGLTRRFPSFLLGLTAFLVGEKLRALFPPPAVSATPSLTDFAASVAHRLRHETAQRRMTSLSNAFSSLSDLFYDLSRQLRHPRATDYKRICQSVLDKNCATCRNRKECWGKAFDRTERATDQIVQRLIRHGRINADHLSVEFRESCPRAASIAEQINAACAHMAEVMLRSEKTEVFAADYEAIATMLKVASQADNGEYHIHKETADSVFSYLSEQGIAVQGVVVCGKRERHITVRGRHFERGSKKAVEIKEKLEDICGMRLTEPAFERRGEYTVMTLSSLPRMTTTYSGSTVPSDMDQNEPLPRALTHEAQSHEQYAPPNPCGDHIAIFTNEQAYFYALISDGMGSGPDASFTSDICTIFLEKMLSAGSQADVSVKMLNNFIRSKNMGSGDECSATVDLMELDLNNGHAIFVKSGAAPTYVVRSGTVYKLHSRTVPIGIFKDSEPQLLRFRMHPGDVIVMVSDGVTHGNDECPWLIDLLSDPLPSSMDSLRLDILKHAITSGSPDDLSAIAVRVEDAQKNT